MKYTELHGTPHTLCVFARILPKLEIHRLTLSLRLAGQCDNVKLESTTS
uniref:Uncharacterized protein n=1 Tax=Anguilla anguilla TaxID=7936 RepID=A0A0E9PKY9_ANGAN